MFCSLYPPPPPPPPPHPLIPMAPSSWVQSPLAASLRGMQRLRKNSFPEPCPSSQAMRPSGNYQPLLIYVGLHSSEPYRSLPGNRAKLAHKGPRWTQVILGHEPAHLQVACQHARGQVGTVWVERAQLETLLALKAPSTVM
jgi:hypothetical protein